ncbi:MAG: OmpA family protein [Spirochaetia bacterium]|nr:OmpA family protein [Spirochaetia bacterium]
MKIRNLASVRGLAWVILLLVSPAVRAEEGGEVFRFRLDKDDVYIIEKYQDVKSSDGKTPDRREEKNRIALTVIEREPNGYKLEGWFYTYARTGGRGEFFKDKDYFSRFTLREDGQYIVPHTYVMPNLRDMPTFPRRAIAPDERWTESALETMDFDFQKIMIPLKVDYTYMGKTAVPERAFPGREPPVLPQFQFTYTFQKTVPNGPIRGVRGQSVCTLWFNNAEGIPVFDQNRIVYQFLLADGRIIAAEYKIDSWYRKVKRTKPEEKKELADKITKDLEKEKNVTVREEKNGIALDLNAILFEHNSARLTPESREGLAAIADVLKKHPDREVRVSGHTDSTGSYDYNQKLSEERARSVVKTLTEEHGIDRKRLSYKGFGQTKPVDSNTTPEGRAKNRRVEVLIVTD